MHKVKVYSIDGEDIEDEKYKTFVVVKPTPDELPPKVKYKEILKEEDDFLDEK